MASQIRGSDNFDSAGNTSTVRLRTSNGSGSSNTMIRRFTTSVSDVGSDITYADSATLGGTFTINTTGIYSISYGDIWNAASWMGISLNSSQLTTAILSITAADRLMISTTTAAGYAAALSWTGHLTAADVIRAHESGTAEHASTQFANFTITKVG